MTGTKTIPFFGTSRQYANLREEILEVTDEVYRSGIVLDGPSTQIFEQLMAKVTERRYAVSVNSGTAALEFAIRSTETHDHERSKILIPAVSYVATLNAVLEAGYEPVFCDVDPVSGLMDLNKIPVALEELAAIVYVNLYGNIVDWDKMQHFHTLWNDLDIPIIEDAAQSFGAYWRGLPSGKLGLVSCLSFDPTKNLNNYGSGGMVLTDDHSVARAVRGLKNNDKANDHTSSGTNSQIGEADCAQLAIKLKYFETWQKRRVEIADYYRHQLQSVARMPTVDSRVEHSWHKFAIHVADRQRFRGLMAERGVETRIHYQMPLHLHNVAFGYTMNNNLDALVSAEQFCKTTVSIPIYPELSDTEVEQIVDAVIDCID